jgi:hypothetical protein
MSDTPLAETPSADPVVEIPATTFTVDPTTERPLQPGDIKTGELMDIVKSKSELPPAPLPSHIQAMLEKQKFEQERARKRYYDLAAKLAKDVIFVAAKLKMKPIALGAMRESAIVLMQQKNDPAVVAVSIGIPDSITQLSILKYHMSFPVFDKETSTYQSYNAETKESTSEVINQFVIEGLTTEFKGAVCFRDGSIALGDPKTFFTQLMMSKMHADAQKIKLKNALKQHHR